MSTKRSLSFLLAATCVGLLALAPLPSRTPATAQSSNRVKWRFRLEADYALHRAAVGADGTIYVNTVNGKLYAINPDGTQRWLFQAGLGGGAYGPVSVGADGTIYIPALVPKPGGGSTGGIYAVNPNGTQKWLFNGTGGGTIIAGPNVGPDGNIYAVVELPGVGLFSLTPSGQLRFSKDAFTDLGPLGEEIVFGSSQLYFGFDGGPGLFAYRLDGGLVFRATASSPGGQLQPAVGPNGNIYIHTFPIGQGRSLGAFSPQGVQLWNFYEFPGNEQTHPDVGSDNTIYMGRNLSTLLALNSTGTVKWRYVDPGILFSPIVSPLNTLVFMGGRVNYGEPGFFAAISSTGSLLWKINLPVEPGFAPYGQIILISRARFSADGNTAYIATDVAGDGSSSNPFSYLYAVDTSGSPPPPSAGCSGTGTLSIRGGVRTSSRAPVAGATLALSGPGGCTNTTTTSSQGNYQFALLANGTYTVTPSKTGCTFTPSNRTVTITGTNITAAFTASCI